MLSQFYRQTVAVDLNKTRIMHYFGTILKCAALVTIPIALFFNIYILVLGALLFCVGVLLNQCFFSQTAEWEYDYDSEKLIFFRIDVLKGQKCVAEVKFDSVLNFEPFFAAKPQKADMYDAFGISRNSIAERVFTYTDSKHPDGYCLTFVNDGLVKIRFSPDDYLVGLINNRLCENNDIS